MASKTNKDTASNGATGATASSTSEGGGPPPTPTPTTAISSGMSVTSVQTSFTKKGKGWECKSCSMLNFNDGNSGSGSAKKCEMCGEERKVAGGGSAGAKSQQPKEKPSQKQKVELTQKHQKEEPSTKKQQHETQQKCDPPSKNRKGPKKDKKKEDPPRGDKAGGKGGGNKHQQSGKRGGGGKRDEKNQGQNQGGKKYPEKKHPQQQQKQTQQTSQEVKVGAGQQYSSIMPGTGLPGEGTSAVVAQLLGLKMDDHASKSSGSTGNSKGSNIKKDSTKKKTSFANQVEDIGNAQKLDSKIMGDHRAGSASQGTKKQPSKQQQQQQQQHGPVDRRAIAVIPTSGFGGGSSDLSANAAAFVPHFGGGQQQPQKQQPQKQVQQKQVPQQKQHVPSGQQQQQQQQQQMQYPAILPQHGFNAAVPHQQLLQQQQMQSYQQHHQQLANKLTNYSSSGAHQQHSQSTGPQQQHDGKGGGKHKKGDKNKNKQHQQHHDSQQNNKNQSQKGNGNAQQQSTTTSSNKGKSSVNLTLQAIQQSKQKQKEARNKAAKEDTSNKNDKSQKGEEAVAAERKGKGGKGKDAKKQQVGNRDDRNNNGANTNNQGGDLDKKKKKGETAAEKRKQKRDQKSQQNPKEEHKPREQQQQVEKTQKTDAKRKDKQQQQKQNQSSGSKAAPSEKKETKVKPSTTDSAAKGKGIDGTDTDNNKKLSRTNFAPAIPPSTPQTTNDLNYGAGRAVTVVHIAEKPSIGQSIAEGLSGGSTSKSYGKSLPVHEFKNPSFPKAPKASEVNHIVTSVAGHVFNVDFPSEFQSWDSVDPAELFHAPVVKKPCKGSIVKHLQEVTKGADFMVLWMDCDREGENINFEVLECCLHLLRGSAPYDRVYRAHFSAINPSDIKKAYNALGKPDRCQSLSVDARQELDLKVGVAFSRFQTRFFQGRYGDLDSAVLSYGPCQTPTLGFCVQRHIEMETFKPEPYWLLDLGIMNSGTMCRATWDAGRSFNRSKVEAHIAKCREASRPPAATVLSVLTKDKKQGRPVPLNTVALLKACSKALAIGPHQALSVAERLYLSGYLSYPRTESTKYPKSFDIEGTLRDQTQDNRWGSYVSELLRDAVNVAKGGVDMGDHPPITPCRHARAGELSGDMARVYDLVTRHFIASVSHDAVWKSTTVRLSIDALEDKGLFTIRGKQLATPGFLAIMLHKQYGDEREEGCGADDEEEEEEKNLPEFKEGDQYGLFFSASKKSDKVSVTPASGKFCTLDVKERMTTPPTYLTESELISRMEKNGIGTDASISTHIENILKRNYVELIPGRKLKPSRLGLVLAQGYHLIDDSLVLPKIRSDIEGQCNKIAKGLADREEVVKKAIELFSAKFNYFVDNINKMDVLFGSSFAQLQDVGKPFTRCGLTRRYLQFITGPPPRLYNKTTEIVYPLPIGGEIKQWTGRHCPVEGCNFELCLYSVGAPPRTFPLCPNCYNNHRPEFGPQPGEEGTPASKQGDEEDEAKERSIRRMAGKNMVRECPHPDKHPLIEEMTVSPDPESDGVLILDPHLGPKWRLVSTREPTIVHLPKSVEKITILDRKDEILNCHMLSIEFKEGQSPIEGKKKYISCFANDEVLQGLVRVHHGDERLKASGGRGRGGRGRGRGGGRGGRGRGRGGSRRG